MIRALRRLAVGSTAALLLASCGTDVVFIGDPALEASVVDTTAFERTLEQAGERGDARLRVVWPEADRLGDTSFEELIAAHEARQVVLSPYASLLAPELASAFPARRFVAFYGSVEQDNLIWVRFDATEAMREAGALVARWVFAVPGRSAALLVDESRRDVRSEAIAFEAGYEAEADVPLAAQRFDVSPDREDVRGAVQRLRGEGEQAFVVLLGSASPVALELLRNEEVLLGLRHARLSDDPARTLFVVRDDLADGVDAALIASRGAGGTIVVDSRLVAGTAVRDSLLRQ